MLVVKDITAIRLQAARIERSIHVGGHSVEVEVPRGIGKKMHAAVATVTGDLKIQVTRRFLVGQHTVVIPLILVLVQIGGRKRSWLSQAPRKRGILFASALGI